MAEQEQNKEQYLNDLEKMSPDEILEKYGAAKLVEMLKEGKAAEERVSVLERQNRNLKEDKESLEKQNFDLRFDQLTNLEMRRSYYMRVNKAIEHMLDDETTGIADISEKDEVTADDMEKMKYLTLTVAAADLAYLSKYNNDPDIQVATGGEHEGGDKILKETAAIIQDVDKDSRTIQPKLNVKTRGYRVGGDEFALLMETTAIQAETIVNEFKIKQTAIDVPGADLPPMINVDIAHISEGVNAFTRVFEKKERAEMSSEERAKKIQDLMTRIADRRAMLQKGRERIVMLVDILEEDEAKFDKNFTFMKKGAFGLEKDYYIDLLKKRQDDPDGFKKLVNKEVSKQLLEQRERAKKQEAKEYAAVIEIADAKYQEAA